ncbi:DUF523 domain-containing protein [Burkholderiaceae bacterium DAT-1]|nr:DUF523 domain-containing protein [Burkholderiaceae bacterium DAT-1]
MQSKAPSVLISACLLGDAVRYDGRSKGVDHPAITMWINTHCLVKICPEVSGGLPVPRLPAEIISGGDPESVRSGRIVLHSAAGQHVSEPFLRGAQAALKLAKAHGVCLAVLKEGSPSCGSGYVYNGQFDGGQVSGQGISTTVLRDAGIPVFSEHALDEALVHWQRIASHTL